MFRLDIQSFSWCPLLLVLSLCDNELNLAPYVLHTPCRYIHTLMRFSLSFIQTKQFQFSQPFLEFEVLQSCHHLSALVLGMFQEVYIFSFNVGPETRHSSPDTTSPCWIKTKYHFPWDAGTAVMIMRFYKAILLAHVKFCVHQDPQVFLRKVAFRTVCPQVYTIIWDGSSPEPKLPISLTWTSKKLPTESSKWIFEAVKGCWKSWNLAFCPAPYFQDFKFRGHCIQIFSRLSYPCAVLSQSCRSGSC